MTLKEAASLATFGPGLEPHTRSTVIVCDGTEYSIEASDMHKDKHLLGTLLRHMQEEGVIDGN